MKKLETQKTKIGTSLFALFIIIFAILGSMLGYLFKNDTMSASAETTLPVSALHRETKIYSPKYSADYYSGCETIFYKGIMPSEKVSDLPVDCNTLAGSVNL